ncbi:TraB/GumN family protein [Kangiella japonica]|uniref:TraB/GumN family protein n=1 Tax=Kangiella japonica TaxID=647384 RepID=A0ABN0T108_9GAMM
MNKYLGILFATLVGLAGCGEESAKSKAHEQPKQAIEQIKSSTVAKSQPKETLETSKQAGKDYTPALWKVEHGDSTSYLFGSIHMGDASMFPLPDVVNQAFESTDALAVEIDMGNINQLEMAQTLQQLAIDPNTTLESMLKKDTWEKYNEFCEETKTPCGMFNTFEPWLAAVSLESLNMKKSGYTEKYGIDMYFLGQARDKKEIIALETVNSQLSMLDSMPLYIQDAFLLSIVTREGDGIEELVQAWKTGNVEEYIENSFEEADTVGLSSEEYEQLLDLLLYKRNKSMAEGLAKQFEQGKNVFAVVGAAHYGGDKSINHYLQELGYKVERVTY